jgi:hypothetical protein
MNAQGVLVIDNSIIGFGLSDASYVMPEDGSNGNMVGRLTLQDQHHSEMLQTSAGMSWWSNTNNWEESCMVVIRHEFNVVDTTLNWNGSVSMGYEPHAFQMSFIEQNYNEPDTTNMGILVNGGFGGNIDHWWMQIEDAQLIISDESQGYLITKVEYADVNSDLTISMSLQVMDNADEVVLHADNNIFWPSREFQMTSLMNWEDVMNWNISTLFYAKNHGYGMTFVEKNYDSSDDSYNLLASTHAIYHGKDYTSWSWKVEDTKLGFGNEIIGSMEALMEFTDATAHVANGVLRGYVGLFNGAGEVQLLTDQAWVWNEIEGKHYENYKLHCYFVS